MKFQQRFRIGFTGFWALLRSVGLGFDLTAATQNRIQTSTDCKWNSGDTFLTGTNGTGILSEKGLNMQIWRRMLRASSRFVVGFAVLPGLLASHPALAQTTATASTTTPLQLFRNYIVTGDYVVGGVGLRGLGVNGFATGTISIPDANSVPAQGVPSGADIVAAFLYWQTVESSQSAFAGQNGFFNGYAISGTILGNPNAPVSWSSGGCSGSSNGSKTMRTYRADVRPYLYLDANGNYVGNASYVVKLADSGSNGGGTPLTLGATLVLVYRVLSPAAPLDAIVLYDGAYAPSNASTTMIQPMEGFYQAASTPVAKLTHIVGNGQTNKSEAVYLGNVSLPSLYGNNPPFPGTYNGSWDNPTWLANNYGSAVHANDSSETTSVIPSGTSSGCVSWGAVIFSSTVQDTDGDGLLDIWEDNQGYTDAVSGDWVALPGANKLVPDIFVELDWLSDLDGSAGAPLHSHLPKQQALDMVGQAFGAHNIHLHLDLGPNVYAGDPYVIPYPVATPAGATTFPGAGGNAISENALLCTDGTTLCAFPGQPAVAWKGGLEYLKNQPTLGNFEPGRAQSYRYMLWGHSLGLPRSYWSAWGATVSSSANPLAGLVSIVNSGTTARVTIQSPPNFLKPGDSVSPGQPGYGDANLDRVTITGALNQTGLNGSYRFSNLNSNTSNNVTTTSFTITTANVANGTYNFSNEPELAVAYAGPVSSSGHSDIGGGDSAVTFGLWTADDPAGCQPNPTSSLSAGQVYCNNEVGNTVAQAGTLMHELGHTLALTHGGTYYAKPQNNPSGPASYGLNCKPNYLSVMNYLFQIRGFPDGGVDYSGQTFADLNETDLNESVGIGSDIFTGQPAAHYTRWYGPPNATDTKIQNTTGGRYATSHCDGTQIGPNEPPAVRVDGNTYSAPIDWNNDLIVPDTVSAQDVNFNGIIGDASFVGFNDWSTTDLRQMGARPSLFGLSGGGIHFGGGGIAFGGGGIAFGGGGIDFGGGGIAFGGGGIAFGGGGIHFGGGGTDQDFETANSTADAPNGLAAVPYPKNTHYVQLSWNPPSFGQVRTYYVWRATGNFSTLASATANYSLFSNIGKVSGSPPATTFIDQNVKNNTTYTYFVTEANKQGVQSGASAPSTIKVKF
jgi:hypothetical protein